MKVLLVGGCGYIGSALYEDLKSKGYSVPSIDLEWYGRTRPLGLEFNCYRQDYNNNTKLIHEADAIIMVAAHSSVGMCQKDPYGAFENNVGNFVRLLRKLEAIPSSQRPKLIYASSSCVYTGLTWKCVEDDELMSPVDHLTLTKQTIDHYAMQSDVEFYGLRFGSVNGWSPNMRADLMINAMTLDAIRERVVHVSNPEMSRPILGMKDLCRAVEAILNCGKDKRNIYNVASFNRTIREIGQEVADLKGAKLQVGGSPGGYDFSMKMVRFVDKFNFNFQDSVTTIVEDLVAHEVDKNPGHLRQRNMEYTV